MLETFARARDRSIVLDNFDSRSTETLHSAESDYQERLFKQEIKGIHAVLNFAPPADYSSKSSFNAPFMVGRMPMAPSDADAFVVSLCELARTGIIAASRFLGVHDHLKTPVHLLFDQIMKAINQPNP